ncbi:cellulose synthase [Roseibium sp. RKSG952]|uniref:cellulose synthase n=1 Tax=Roseibium sp. RKSG952 TaxID=2529384 RepID=UPI0012BC5026|nr:cellulose synthase [Roseibium sp. RKSG952]MTH99311.1 cellulose synthase [Roseibium sp. RKSG952]
MKHLVQLVLLTSAVYFAHTVLFADDAVSPRITFSQDRPEIQPVKPAADRVVQPGGTRVTQSSGDAESGTSPRPEDLAGLRYFAQTGDAARYRIEIERLQALYPGWQPPASLSDLQTEGDPQLDLMWQLFGEEKYAQVRKLIEERVKSDPDWSPPADLLANLTAAEARVRLVNASGLQQYDTVIRVAAENPGLLTCANVDIIWRVAKAFAERDRLERAKDAYSYILENCSVPSERIATLQKALEDLPRDMVDQLVATEQAQAGSEEELATIRGDLARLNVSQSLASDSPADDADLKLLETAARDRNSADDAMLLGWYYLGQENFGTAQTWFKQASADGAREEATQGLGLALIGLDRPNEAEELLRTEWQASEDARNNYLAAASALLAARPLVEIGAQPFAAISEAVSGAQDARVAQEIAWYAYEIAQTQTASQWFELALSWQPDYEAAAFGLALSLNKMSEKEALAALVASWSNRSERIADLAVTSGARTQKVAGGTPSGGGGRAAGCATSINPARLSPGTALSRGWCLLNKNRALEAADSFGVALTSGSGRVRSEAAYGQTLAYLRIGLLNQAAISATQASLPPEQARELQLDLLSKRASAAFEAGRYSETLLLLDERRQYAPEPFDLMELRGYAYLQMGRYEASLQIFEALAAAGHRGGERGIITTLEARNAPPSTSGD